jgi:hypothetical protein
VEFVLLIFLDFFAVLCVLLCFVCLRLVSFVPHVASVSGLSNSWSPFRFSLAFITILVSNYRLVSLSGAVVLCQILTWDYCVCCLGYWHDYVIQITWTISLSDIDDQSLSKVKSQWHKEICHHSTERISQLIAYVNWLIVIWRKETSFSWLFFVLFTMIKWRKTYQNHDSGEYIFISYTTC